MKHILSGFIVMILVSACAAVSQRGGAPVSSEAPPTPGMISELVTLAANTAEVDEVIIVTQSPPEDDNFFSRNDITLPSPVCSGLTSPQMEGPYYTPNTPERNSLFEEGMTGTRLVLVGYVLDQNCQPLANAWLDFWQADANGEYDNSGYRLRGHQFTDEQGRYFLETILPGLYASRPIEHIHVKVRPEGGAEVTTQLYFPSRPVEGLTVTLEERGGYYVGYFNFVVQK
jgi:protocatechuate 3,4-dioxygenase beta subunit